MTEATGERGREPQDARPASQEPVEDWRPGRARARAATVRYWDDDTAETAGDISIFMLLVLIVPVPPVLWVLFPTRLWPLAVTLLGVVATAWASALLVCWIRLPRIKVTATRLRHRRRREKRLEVDRAGVREVELLRIDDKGCLRVETWDGEVFFTPTLTPRAQRRLRRVLVSRGWLVPGS